MANNERSEEHDRFGEKILYVTVSLVAVYNRAIKTDLNKS